jgi:valyl-tRNA synthetase
MDKYELGNAATYLYNFVYDDFCSFYIESTKSYLKNEHAKVTKKVLIHVLKGILTMIYPYSPFISEEIYTKLNNSKESIMLETYPVYNARRLYKKEIEVVDLLKLMIKDIRNYKVTNHIAPSKAISVYVKGLELTPDFIEGLQSLSNVVVENKPDAMSNSFIYSSVELVIFDDSSKEEVIKQLNEMLQKTEFEITRATKMLSNENFLKKANPAKVQEEKDKLAKFLEQKENILKKLSNF